MKQKYRWLYTLLIALLSGPVYSFLFVSSPGNNVTSFEKTGNTQHAHYTNLDSGKPLPRYCSNIRVKALNDSTPDNQLKGVDNTVALVSEVVFSYVEKTFSCHKHFSRDNAPLYQFSLRGPPSLC